MLDVQEPHPKHTWKDFFIHIATIVAAPIAVRSLLTRRPRGSLITRNTHLSDLPVSYSVDAKSPIHSFIGRPVSGGLPAIWKLVDFLPTRSGGTTHAERI